MPMTPAEFDALIKKEIVANAVLAKAAGLQAELKNTRTHGGTDMKRLTLMLLSTLALAVGGPASAQDKYPSKPVKIVVPYAPGGGTDITARLFGDQMKNILGQQFVVENKPGAFGILAIEEMARSKPDGYTLMIGNVSTNAITPILFKKKFKIDFEKDVVSVARFNIYPSFLIVTTTNFDVKDVADLVAQAKKNPGKIRYTSAGVGSFPHYDMEIFARRAGVEMIHIPNKTGAAGMLNDLVVGDAQVAFINSATSAAMIKAGKLQPIAVVAEQRAARTIPTCRPWPRRASRASARCTGRACWRRPRRRSR